MCANPQSNTIAVRASYILPFLRRFPRWKSRKTRGGGLSPLGKNQNRNHFAFLSFGGDPLNWQSFIEISEMVCSTTAQCSSGHTLKSRQCSTSVVVMVWFCHATCVSNISLRDKTCSQLLYSHEWQQILTSQVIYFFIYLIIKRRFLSAVKVSFNIIFTVLMANELHAVILQEGEFEWDQETQGGIMTWSVNWLTLRSDQHETSPYNTLTLFSKQVMRIFKLIR